MPAGWTGLEYHVFLLNNIFLMINWSQDGLGWNGEPTGRLSAPGPPTSPYRPLPEADRAPEGAAKRAIPPIGRAGADKYLSAVRWPIGAKIPLGRIRSK